MEHPGHQPPDQRLFRPVAFDAVDDFRTPLPCTVKLRDQGRGVLEAGVQYHYRTAPATFDSG